MIRRLMGKIVEIYGDEPFAMRLILLTDETPLAFQVSTLLYKLHEHKILASVAKVLRHCVHLLGRTGREESLPPAQHSFLCFSVAPSLWRVAQANATVATRVIFYCSAQCCNVPAIYLLQFCFSFWKIYNNNKNNNFSKQCV